MTGKPVPALRHTLLTSPGGLMNPWVPIVHAYLHSRRARGDLGGLSRQTAKYVLTDLTLGVAAVDPLAPLGELADAIVGWSDRPSWSARTRATNLGYVRPMLDWGAVRGLVTPGVARELPAPRCPKPLPRALNKEQVAEVLAAAPDARGRVILLLEGQCGLRRAEVASLDLGDVDLLDGSLRVTGKGSKTRVVYPSDETLDAIRAYLVVRGRGPGALVCHEHHPGRRLTPTWIGVLVSHWMADAGLKSGPGDGVSGHALRHSTATNLLRDGANIRVVQEAMGHEKIATTAAYLRVENEEVRAAMSRLRYGSRRLRAVEEPA